ncbi:MAG TPA: cysteine dioxygenase family protein [Trebonia sp.]|nr:cysteine dioxygenase family protein [Trebonia sp.]
MQPTIESQEPQGLIAPEAPRALTREELAAEVRRLAGHPAQWVARVRLDAEGRWYEQIHVDDTYELWLISWLPGHSTGFHDHGGANGAFSVVWGTLDECVVRHEAGRVAEATVGQVTHGVVRDFGPHYIHDVRNTSDDTVAVSIHAYSPPLTAMTRYDLAPGGLVPATTETSEDW